MFYTYISTVLCCLMMLVLPGCGGNQITRQESIMARARSAYGDVAARFAHEIDAVAAEDELAIFKKIKTEILVKNELHTQEMRGSFWKAIFGGNTYELYPFIQYKLFLDQAIDEIVYYARALIIMPSGQLRDDLHRLLDKLNQIKRCVIAADEYQQERFMYAQSQAAERQLYEQRKATQEVADEVHGLRHDLYTISAYN